MSHASHTPLVKNSRLEAVIQCGSYVGTCYDERLNCFLIRWQCESKKMKSRKHV